MACYQLVSIQLMLLKIQSDLIDKLNPHSPWLDATLYRLSSMIPEPIRG